MIFLALRSRCPWLARGHDQPHALIVPQMPPVQAVAVTERVRFPGPQPRAPESSPLSRIRSVYLSRFPSMPSTTAPIMSMVSCSRRL